MRLHFNETLETTLPNVLYYRSTPGYKHSTVHVILHQPMSRPDREGRSPSKGFFDDGRDVREVVDIGMIWQPFATKNAVELTLGRSHDFSVPSHCEEKAVQHGDCLQAGKNILLSGSMMTRTVFAIPAGNNQWEDLNGANKARHTKINKRHGVVNDFHVNSLFVQSFQVVQTR